MEEKEITQVNINKCPHCGANLEYDIESGLLKCPHCDFTKTIDNDDNVTRRTLTDDILKTKENWSEGNVYRCENCGATSVVNKKEISKVCPFCASANISCTNEICGIKPDSVIPFQITRDRAAEIFKKWSRSRKLSPRIFKTEDIREQVLQTYCPAWCFSANTSTFYSGTFGRTEQYTTRNSQGQLSTQYRTRWFNASGNISQIYNDKIYQSSDQISQITFKKLLPFDLKQLKPYRTEYLIGISAQHYSRGLEPCFNDFQNFIKTDLRKKIISRHNADTVQRLDLTINYNEKKFNYVLLPLYIANYTYKKKKYNFYINGISGYLVGKSPISKLKILLLLLLTGISIGFLAYLSTFIH
jgi:DNA-directed RNA polymerase subunit RPC12/RpoP